MRSYDLVYVVRPDLEAEAVQAAVDRMTARIKEQGGTVEAVDVWGKKRMSFVVRRHRDGVFVHTRFALDTNKLDEIRRTAAMSEDVLRARITTAVGPTPQPKAPTSAVAPTPSAPVASTAGSEQSPVAERQASTPESAPQAPSKVEGPEV